MTDDAERDEVERGGVLECGKCRTMAAFDPEDGEYRCPDCGAVV